MNTTSTTSTPPTTQPGDNPTTPRPGPGRRRRVRPARVALHTFLTLTALAWLVPLLWAIYTSLRSYTDTSEHGYLSLPDGLSLDNYRQAWNQSGMLGFFLNSTLITVPAVLITLLFASAVAFFVSRFTFRFNITLLMLFTGANLLPPQVIITPLYHLYLLLPLPQPMSDSELLYNSYWGLITIHVAYQTGFCTFVLSNYMRTIPHELTEAALVDGAPIWRQFAQIILPLCRPAFAALATLQSIWIYNDFFWAIVLISTGDKRPITSALANLQGQFFTNSNLVAAGALMTAIPTLTIYFILQRQFVRGLTLGANKG